MRILIVIVFLAAYYGCGVKTSVPEAGNDGHNSRNSLDWSGVYKGMLPCAGCPGTETVIRLDENGTFVKESRASGKTEIIRSSGSIKWNTGGSEILIESPAVETYKVAENKLIQTGINGKSLPGDVTKYTLNKMNGIQDTYWKLAEVNGMAVSPGQGREAHLIFRSSDNRLAGNGGCNSLSGSYVLDNNKIKFSPIASTKMACENMRDEDRFFRIFEQADNYSVRLDTLILKRSAEPLAKFIAVYFR